MSDQRLVDFLVRRDDLRKVEIVPAPDPNDIELEPGQVLLKIDRFGFTSNNVTYAAFGEFMRYWDFFPAPEGFGRIPVWGYADVATSAHDEIREGERLYGYFPMSAYLVVEPTDVSDGMFADGAAHRAELPAVYQRYSRTAADPTYKRDEEDLQSIWRPLYMTSFGAADFISDHDAYGAKTIVFSSASSKTALGTAFLLSKERANDCEVVGLTSPRNVSFVESTGYYDRVVTYDNINDLPEVPTAYVDFAGNGDITKQLRHRLGDNLKKVVLIGATQWEDLKSGGDDAEFFFLPPWMEKRRGEWGPKEFFSRYGTAWSAFMPTVQEWMKVDYREGPVEIESAYRDMLDGNVAPEIGLIFKLNP